MPQTRREAGDSKLSCSIWIFLLIAAIWTGFQMIPAKIASAELDDFISEQAQFRGKMDPRRLEKGIVDRAQELKLPLKEKDVRVEKLPYDQVRITAKYTVPVNFIVYEYPWVIEHDITESTFGSIE